MARRSRIGDDPASRHWRLERHGLIPRRPLVLVQRRAVDCIPRVARREAARGATDPARLSGSDPSRLEDPAVVYRRKVLSNKIEIVRAELSVRGGQAEPD